MGYQQYSLESHQEQCKSNPPGPSFFSVNYAQRVFLCAMVVSAN